MFNRSKIVAIFAIAAPLVWVACGGHKKDKAGGAPAPGPAPAATLDTVLVGQQPGQGSTTITYRSSSPGATFDCRVIRDGQNEASVAWEGCPDSGKVISTAGVTSATLEVRAVKDGVPDTSPLRVAIQIQIENNSLDTILKSVHYQNGNAVVQFDANRPDATFETRVIGAGKESSWRPLSKTKQQTVPLNGSSRLKLQVRASSGGTVDASPLEVPLAEPKNGRPYMERIVIDHKRHLEEHGVKGDRARIGFHVEGANLRDDEITYICHIDPMGDYRQCSYTGELVYEADDLPIGTYTVTVKARMRGRVVKDEVTFEVR